MYMNEHENKSPLLHVHVHTCMLKIKLLQVLELCWSLVSNLPHSTTLHVHTLVVAHTFLFFLILN